MAIVKIPFNSVSKFDIVNTKGMTAGGIATMYKPSAFINLALYDMSTKQNIVKMIDEFFESGYLFSERGIGITKDNKLIWTTLADAKADENVRDFVAGAPTLVIDGKVQIDWGNKVSTQIQGKHIRSAIGFNDEGLFMYVSDSAITLDTLAQEMLKYGCKYAINCDGGGSSHLQTKDTIYKNSLRANPSWFLVYEKEEERVDKKYKVVLDAGHGASTAGKRSPDGKFREYRFNRTMVDKVANLLLTTGQIEVIKTCPDENDLSLTGRANLANKADADLFVSIHTNASSKVNYLGNSDWDSARGWEAYVCAKGGNAEKLAKKIEQYMKQINPETRMRGIKVAQFTVLVKTDMPAVLIESGFMNNQEEVAKLSTEAYQNKLALAYASGIAAQLGLTLKLEEDKPVETDDTLDWAITVLAANGVINSEDYWIANKDKVPYLPQLLINMAQYIEENK